MKEFKAFPTVRDDGVFTEDAGSRAAVVTIVIQAVPWMLGY